MDSSTKQGLDNHIPRGYAPYWTWLVDWNIFYGVIMDQRFGCRSIVRSGCFELHVRNVGVAKQSKVKQDKARQY